MPKFVIECPACGKYAEARTGFFARKKLDCACGHTIDIRTDKLTGRECPHCGNMVVFDQSKGDRAVCPVCHEPINTLAEQTKTEEFSCAQCGVRLRTSKSASTYTCPVCDFENDVQERLTSEHIKKDGLASIIKYEGDNETLVWKHPIEDFNLGSQLIVHESQEAIFFRDGQALDLFGAGRYTLETQQLPLLERLYQLPTDTEGTFHSEVYFINKTVQMAIKWGTPEKVRFIDPLTGVPLALGASGEMNLQVLDSRKLILKLVGTMGGIAWGDAAGFAKSLQASFRPLISNSVKTALPAIINEEAIDILEIDGRLNLISQRLRERILPGLEEYGLIIPQFYVTNIVLPEDDPNFKRIRELHTITLQTRVIQAEAAAKRLEGLTEAEVMQAKGYNQKDVLQADVQKAYAAGLGQMGSNGGGLGDVAGLGVALGAMGGVIGMTKEAVAPMFGGTQPQTPPADTWNCPSCGKTGITSRFCPDCGAKRPAPAAWDCPGCGEKGIASKFCPNCGRPRRDRGRSDRLYRRAPKGRRRGGRRLHRHNMQKSQRASYGAQPALQAE